MKISICNKTKLLVLSGKNKNKKATEFPPNMESK